ncbi:MAG: DUF2256 domain-containing protein [Chitinophagaceae bacterium]|nr:DUF2256 domain-containing protein [Chitinophagaceae bacterium]
MKTTNKKNRPVKTCLVCQRPFNWRKKWEKNWEEIKYCSSSCRSAKKPVPVS